MEGWIKIHRKIQDNWLWKEKRKFSKFEAWMSLLLKANHKENKILFGNDIINIKAGSFITSEVKLADEWNWSRNTVRTFLTLLQNEKMLNKFCTTKYTMLSIENWALYQFEEQQIEQQVEQQIEHQKDIKLNTNKNDKNIKNEKNEKNIIKEKGKKETEIDKIINANFTDKEIIETIYEFIKMRKSIKKPLTTRGLELMIKKLYTLSTNIDEQIMILNNSIMNNWQGIFALKKDNFSKSNKGSFDDFKDLWEEARIKDEQTGNGSNNNTFGW